MQLGIREHFEYIVLPSIVAYRESEKKLSESGQVLGSTLNIARYDALREGSAAAIFLHHFADIIAKRPPPGLPDFDQNPRRVERWLVANYGATDIEILKDTAEAVKHAVLTRGLPREVEENGQVLIADRPYGSGRYGEGKFGGTEELWVLGKSGRRSLGAILDNVSRAWIAMLDHQGV